MSRPHTYTDEDDAVLREMRSRDMTYVDISKITGRSIHSIGARCKDLGIARQHRGKRPADPAKSGAPISSADTTMPSKCPMAPVLEREGVTFADVHPSALRAETGVVGVSIRIKI